MRKFKISVLLKLGFYCLFLSIGLEMQARKFVHPGILHTTKSIERMRAQIADKEYPAYGSFELLKSHHCSQADYQPFGPFEIISRDGEFRHTKSKMEQDFSAVYQNALMWVLTGEKTHAEKSLELLLGYAGTLKRIPETNDAPLLVGLEGLKIIYATEILRHTYKKMTVVQFNEISRMIREVFLPVMENFYHRKPYTNGNWGPIVTKAYMAAAILWDNEEMYNKAVDFYLHANDNGTIAHYISGDTGQIQESGRDQGHSMLGIGALATVCEIAWQQGDDLYSALDNRLMKGFEYVAKYNLGYNVPFAVWKDVTGKYSNWTEISNKGRGRYMPIFEMTYNHFVIRKGMQMPYTEQVLRQIRPEGYDRDQPAFGSLLFNEAGTKKNYVDLVNPFVDSHRSRWFFFSSACRPFGMVSLSPDTDTEHSWGSGYLYDSKQIRCFSHVHNWQMSGVAVMPTVGEFKGHLGMNAYQSAFTHDGEIAKPGYHKVKLTDYDITAELTSTMRVGFHCYTFPKSDASYILFDTKIRNLTFYDVFFLCLKNKIILLLFLTINNIFVQILYAMSEKELIILLKNGDEKAFTTLYRLYWSKVYNFSRLYLSSITEVEEVVQEVFVKVWETRDFLRADDNFKGYLFIITRNLIFNQFRKSFNENAYKLTVLSAAMDYYDMEDELSAADLKEFIKRMVGGLPPRQQEVFKMSRDEHLTYKEIATRLNISEKTVERHINEAIKFLKKNIMLYLIFIF